MSRHTRATIRPGQLAELRLRVRKLPGPKRADLEMDGRTFVISDRYSRPLFRSIRYSDCAAWIDGYQQAIDESNENERPL